MFHVKHWDISWLRDIEIAKKKLNSRLPLSHQIYAIPKGI